jgi:multiple sugar transport system permease protein
MAATLLRRRGRPLAWLVLGLTGLVYLLPLYWLLVTSLKSKAELYRGTVTLYPHAPTLEAYERVLVERGFWMLLRNSLLVCGATVLVTLALGLLITYPITRLRASPRLRQGVLNRALSLRFLPPVAVVIPYFAVVRTAHLYDTPQALILIYSLFNLPFAIWMLKGFLDEIPAEIEEAAYTDGGDRWTVFRRVLLPLAAPGLLASGIIVFTFTWSEFLFALILTATPRSQTFPVGVQGLVTQFEVIWNDMAASGAIAMALPLVLALLARRYLVAGLTFGVIREK